MSVKLATNLIRFELYTFIHMYFSYDDIVVLNDLV